jgi:hypothetical protein
MAKGKDIKGMLGKKSPAELRKGIQQIDILQEAAAALTPEQAVKETDISEEEEQTVKVDTKSVEEKPSDFTDKKKRSTETISKTERTNRSTSRRKPKVFSSKDVQAVLETDKRQTERYSFEIYSDQKADIEHVCRSYEQVTGKKLSASRLIREVLDTFLPDALKTFETSGRENTEE